MSHTVDATLSRHGPELEVPDREVITILGHFYDLYN